MLATDTLRAHHNHMRDLMATLVRPDLPAATRRQVLDELVAELSMHEQIEDEIFYPAMHNISTLVGISHAEHRELDDQVMVVLRISDDPVRFAEEFAALVSTFEHHAREEETAMFPEVQDKVDHDVLHDIGARLAARLEHLRSSPITRARMRLKRTILRHL